MGTNAVTWSVFNVRSITRVSVKKMEKEVQGDAFPGPRKARLSSDPGWATGQTWGEPAPWGEVSWRPQGVRRRN